MVIVLVIIMIWSMMTKRDRHQKGTERFSGLDSPSRLESRSKKAWSTVLLLDSRLTVVSFHFSSPFVSHAFSGPQPFWLILSKRTFSIYLSDHERLLRRLLFTSSWSRVVPFACTHTFAFVSLPSCVLSFPLLDCNAAAWKCIWQHREDTKKTQEWQEGQLKQVSLKGFIIDFDFVSVVSLSIKLLLPFIGSACLSHGVWQNRKRWHEAEGKLVNEESDAVHLSSLTRQNNRDTERVQDEKAIQTWRETHEGIQEKGHQNSFGQ